MKTINDRRAKILGFNCYYDLATGDMRSQGGDLRDWAFTIALLINLAYRKLAWKLFFQLIALKMNIIPDEGEDLQEMYMKMAELIEERKQRDGRA